MPAPSVEDRLAIQDLFARYMWALDGGDADGILDCFTIDGALESPAIGRREGQDGLREFATRFSRFHANGAQLRHIISNIRCEVDGDRAKARCYLVVYLTRNGGSRLLGPGHYDCDLRREGGRWLFETRRVLMDHDYELEGL
jgi:uncharacterized protein (TIGR02246 family)